ncbi:hypothetical protein Gotri_006242 [Gossypium trilobum]|uniref:Uncharacterized protein n=1 Tax=Gossypium trilobum TaxID=34281 RepID=A0A7J9EZ88_9ROSI|nr:hypothetical protein [Gossypium trilobum]
MCDFPKLCFPPCTKSYKRCCLYLAAEGLKRNETTYLVGDVLAYALDVVEVNRR